MDEARLKEATEILETIRMVREHIVRNYPVRTPGDDDEEMCHDLTFPQFKALTEIHDHGEITIKELAEALFVSPPSASAMVDRLVDMGMLLREHCTEDRRVVRVRISEQGDRSVLAMRERFLRGIVDLLEQLGPELAQQWCNISHRIREIMSQEREEERSALPK